jgi:hypothetical protein
VLEAVQTEAWMWGTSCRVSMIKLVERHMHSSFKTPLYSVHRLIYHRYSGIKRAKGYHRQQKGIRKAKAKGCLTRPKAGFEL